MLWSNVLSCEKSAGWHSRRELPCDWKDLWLHLAKVANSSAREERNHLWKVVLNHVRLIPVRLSNEYISRRLLDQTFNSQETTPAGNNHHYLILNWFVYWIFKKIFITHLQIWKGVVIKPKLAWLIKLTNTCCWYF